MKYKIYTSNPTYWENIPDIIQIHKRVRQTGLPNFGVVGFQFKHNSDLIGGASTLNILG